MRLFIVGQKWIAAALLEQCLADGYDVAGVAASTADDRLALAAAQCGLSVALAARRLEAQDVPERVDFILAANAHCFIPADARMRAARGVLGYHPSLLPRHRGRDAIRWAIHMCEPVTGGTVYWMDDGADTGPIALQDWCHIRPDDTAAALWKRELAPMGLRLFREALLRAAGGRLPSIMQDGQLATWEPGFSAPRLAVR